MIVLDDGRTIGGLRIGRLLGHGAMGEVYRAEQLVLGRAVAVKRILPQHAGSASAIERLGREARVLASVHSPYVVQIHDLIRVEGEILLVMELVEGGGSLRAWCGRLPWTDATCLIRHLAEALAAAHAVGVVHRDVKPDNALLAGDGVARLGDFGLARAVDSAQLTAAGSVVGTPAYLAPECRTGEAGGMPSDIYALGCTWYHLLTGQPPYRGSDVADLLRRHAEEPPPDASGSGLDPALAGVLASCLAKDAARRPEAADLAARLRGHPAIPERLSSVRAAEATAMAATLTPATAPTAVSAPVETATPAAATKASAEPPRQRRRWLVPLLVVAVLVVGLSIAVPGLMPDRYADHAAVRQLAKLGMIAEARAKLVPLAVRDPEPLVRQLVRDVDLAEARKLWRTDQRDQALTLYRNLLRNNPGDLIACRAVIDDLPEHEPVVLEAVLALPALTQPKDVAIAWRWILPANGVASYYGRLVELLAAVPGGTDDVRRRLGAEDEAERQAALDILLRLGAATDGDRIRYHAENMVRLHSGFSQAAVSCAWLQAESAKPEWAARKRATVLPAFTDILALRSNDELGDAVEHLLGTAFAEETRPLLPAWRQHEDEVVRIRAARLAVLLAHP